MEPKIAIPCRFDNKVKSSSIVSTDRRDNFPSINTISGLEMRGQIGSSGDGSKPPSVAAPGATSPRESLRATRATQNCRPEPDLPTISAQSYCIYDCNTKQLLLSEEQYTKREVASLTKMMTLLTVIKLMQRFGMTNPAKVLIKISRTASRVTGTTANLQENDVLSVE